MDDKIGTGTDMGKKGDTEKTGDYDVKDELMTVAHVIRQHTDLTEEQAGQLKETLIYGFTDANGRTAKKAACETLVAVMNEPKYRDWKDAGEGTLDKYPSLWQDCVRRVMIWKKEQRLAQAELDKKAKKRRETNDALIADLKAGCAELDKALEMTDMITEYLQLALHANASGELKRDKTDEMDKKDKADQTEKQDKMDQQGKEDKTNEKDKNDKTDKMDETDKTDEIDKNDKTNEVDKKDKMDQQDKKDKTDERDKNDKTDRADETDKTNGIDKNNKTDEIDKTDKTDQMDRTDKFDEMDETDEPKRTKDEVVRDEQGRADGGWAGDGRADDGRADDGRARKGRAKAVGACRGRYNTGTRCLQRLIQY